MSELQFPKDPIVGQEYNYAPYKYRWDGIKWKTIGIGYNPVNDLRDEVLPTTREAIRRSYAEVGFTLVDGSFEEGGTLTSASDVLLHKVSGKAYAWTGTYTNGIHTVIKDTDPTVVGSGYISKANVIGSSTGGSEDGESAKEALRRSYAEAGLIVKGYTDDGVILTSTADVIIHNTTGKGYSWDGSYPEGGYVVTPETDPTLDADFVDESGNLCAHPSIVKITDFRFTGGVDITSGVNSAVPALQAAIDYLRSLGGGGIVDCNIIGAKFLIDAQVVIKSGIWVRGADYPVQDRLYFGTPQLLITHGHGSESAATFLQNTGSCFSGFHVSYPKQVKSDMTDPVTGVVQASPYPYGWFLSLNNASYGTSNIDAPSAGNMYLENPYNGVKYFRTGKFKLFNIYGQPLRRGLQVDGVLDVSSIDRVHWWTYHAAPGSALFSWIVANAEAYLLGYADQVTSVGLFAYGYKYGRRFCALEYGSGGWWGDFYGCLMDVCRIPVSVESVNKVNDYGCDNTTANFLRPCFVTTTTTLPKNGYYAMHGGALNGGSNFGAIISCSNGTFVFDNVNFGEKGNTGCKGASVVVESTASVVISGGKRKATIKVGGVNCVIDGVQMPSTDNQLTLAVDPNLTASWSLKSGTGTTTVNDSGVNFATTATSAIWDYNIPANAKGGYIGVVEFEVLDVDTIDKFLQLTICRSDGAEVSSVLYSSISGASGKGDWLKIRQPVFQGELIDTQVVRLELKSYASRNVSVTIRNLKFYASSTVGDATAQKIITDFCTVPSRFKIRSIRYSSGLKEMTAVSVPAVYNMNSGDYCRSITPASGAALGWAWVGSWAELGVRV